MPQGSASTRHWGTAMGSDERGAEEMMQAQRLVSAAPSVCSDPASPRWTCLNSRRNTFTPQGFPQPVGRLVRHHKTQSRAPLPSMSLRMCCIRLLFSVCGCYCNGSCCCSSPPLYILFIDMLFMSLQIIFPQGGAPQANSPTLSPLKTTTTTTEKERKRISLLSSHLFRELNQHLSG